VGRDVTQVFVTGQLLGDLLDLGELGPDLVPGVGPLLLLGAALLQPVL